VGRGFFCLFAACQFSSDVDSADSQIWDQSKQIIIKYKYYLKNYSFLFLIYEDFGIMGLPKVNNRPIGEKIAKSGRTASQSKMPNWCS
jgi:hypothetical protein